MNRFTSIMLAIAIAPAFTACDKKETPPAAPSAAPADPAAAAPAAPAASGIVQGYDDIRAALADDDLAKTKKLAGDFKAAVAADPASAAMTAGLDAIIAAADIDVARDAFGTLSEAYIKFLDAKPELKAGLTAFRCPMARGYKKWVQRDKKMMNPYMGKAMLECGGETDLTP